MCDIDIHLFIINDNTNSSRISLFYLWNFILYLFILSFRWMFPLEFINEAAFREWEFLSFLQNNSFCTLAAKIIFHGFCSNSMNFYLVKFSWTEIINIGWWSFNAILINSLDFWWKHPDYLNKWPKLQKTPATYHSSSDLSTPLPIASDLVIHPNFKC